MLTRHKEELIVRVYSAMKENLLKCDWIHSVKKDMKEINLYFSDEEIAKLSKKKFNQL